MLKLAAIYTVAKYLYSYLYVLTMAVSLKESSKILINGDYYYLIEIPSDSSKVVLKSTEDLKAIIDMQPLADQLHSLGSFIQVAYASVVGHTDLQIKVRNVYHKVAELCDQSLLAASKFQQSSTSAVDFLQTTYEYFMEGHFKAGLRTPKHVDTRGLTRFQITYALVEITQNSFQNTKSVFKTKNQFSKHKSSSQNTNQCSNTQNQFSNRKYNQLQISKTLFSIGYE